MPVAALPKNHVLRPHHLALMIVITLTFGEEEPILPIAFRLHICRFLLSEVSEVHAPKSWEEVTKELSSGPMADAERSQRWFASLKAIQRDIQNSHQLVSFMHGAALLVTDKSEDADNAILQRRSLLGFFLRRCYLTFLKMSFLGVIDLAKNFASWCSGQSTAGYQDKHNDDLTQTTVIFKGRIDKVNWADSAPYTAYQEARAVGDDTTAMDQIRAFFNQHFSERDDSRIRHLALLHIARMHYARQEYETARQLLEEAIVVARGTNDKLTVQHCQSLMNRIPPSDPSRRPPINEIQPGLHPSEVLYDVNKLMKPEHQQPLSASFERIVDGMGLYDSCISSGLHPVSASETEQLDQHAVQSVVWDAAGCSKLAEIEENIVTAFSEAGGEDNNRLTVTLNRAYRTARQGRYSQAIASLLDPTVWKGLPLQDYNIWAHQVWHVLVLRASRRGQQRMYREFLVPRRPPGSFSPAEYFFGEVESESTPLPLIAQELYTVMEMVKCGQASSVVDQLLTAAWQAEFQGRMNLYRTAILLLANVSLEFGMTKRPLRIVEEIFPQILSGEDREQRGLAFYVHAKCILANSKTSKTYAQDLKKASIYLLTAEADFSFLQCNRSQQDVLYLLSVVYNALGQTKERDEVAQRHRELEQLCFTMEFVHMDTETEAVWNMVSTIGTALATRKSSVKT